MIVEGNVSVKAVLEGNKRKAETLYIKKGKSSKDIAYIRKIAIEHDVTIEILDESSFHAIAPGKTNGGIALSCGSRKREILNDLVQPNAIALLEGIEDPFNLGYCIRSLYSFGFDAVVLPSRNWDNATPQIIKSSAGASEKITLIFSDDLPETITAVKSFGFTMVAAHRSNSISLMDYSWPDHILLAVGGEMLGLSNSVMALVDQRIYIPYANGFRNALNASSAIAVLGYEWMRGRKDGFNHG